MPNERDVSYLPEGTICKNCIYCMSRVIEPLDWEAYEEFGINEEENGDDIIVQSMCLLSEVELHDHVVRSCNKFEDINSNIFMKNKFLV